MKKILFIGSFLVLITFFYLNRSYAYIYSTIDQVQLRAVNSEPEYVFGDSSDPSVKYLAIGDSLTAGVGVSAYEQSYPYLFAQKISEEQKYVILKTGAVPGARTADISPQFIDQVIQIQPDIITLLIGVNDIHGNIIKREFQNNYKYILERLTRETKAKIYIINIPYIGSLDLIRQPFAYYFDMQTREFNKEIKDLTNLYSVEYVDLYTQTLQASQEDSYYAPDLFHPSFEGYDLWAQILYDSFNQ